MKKLLSGIICAVALAATLLVVPANKAYADNVNVSGVVQTGSSTELIKLKTSNGVMDLKIDSSSNLGDKILLPGTQIAVTISYGSDAYWHIVSINGSKIVTDVTVDKNNLSTVSGTVKDANSEGIITFSTSNGEMQIKIDKDTDFSACRCFVGGGSYTIKVGYGSDAYMHAVYVSDGGYVSSSSSSSSSSAASYASNVTCEAYATGTVTSKSTADILALNTPQGEMAIKLDQYEGPIRILVQGQKIKVGLKYGNEYWHAVTITNVN